MVAIVRAEVVSVGGLQGKRRYIAVAKVSRGEEGRAKVRNPGSSGCLSTLFREGKTATGANWRILGADLALSVLS